MQYTIIPGRELTQKQEERWAQFQQADPTLSSPYFRPEFTRLVAAVRNDVYIAVLGPPDHPVGFFPFHRKKGRVARPIGLGLSDYHGIIAAPEVKWQPEQLLRSCGLVRWEFDHLLACQLAEEHKTNLQLAPSPIIDVSQGFAAFEASRDKAGRKQLKEARRKSSRLEEHVGPLRFTLHEPDPKVLEQLFSWKSQQCRDTGTVDYFALPWCVQFISKIHACRQQDFGGILATLHAGDTLVAVHFLMYSRRVWHSWFPAYNHAVAEYSPGFILLIKIIQAAAEKGIEYIDLGKGLSLYKKRVMTGYIEVAEGYFSIPSLYNSYLHLRKKAEEKAKDSWLRPLLRLPGKMIKNWERRGKYD